MLTGKQFRLERATLAVAKNEEGKRRAVTVPRGASRLSRAPVTLGSVLQAGSPKVLFEATIAGAGTYTATPTSSSARMENSFSRWFPAIRTTAIQSLSYSTGKRC